MNAPANPHREDATYLVDNHANVHIHAGDQRIVLQPAGALELLKFLERTQFAQNANVTKGAQS